jgi:hypothetical protein
MSGPAGRGMPPPRNKVGNHKTTLTVPRVAPWLFIVRPFGAWNFVWPEISVSC